MNVHVKRSDTGKFKKALIEINNSDELVNISMAVDTYIEKYLEYLKDLNKIEDSEVSKDSKKYIEDKIRALRKIRSDLENEIELK